MKVALLLFATICGCLASIESDRVVNLPEFPSQLNFSIYSGLLSLPYSNQKQIHYVFLTKAGTQSTVNDAPLILWLNGGPGCSSLDGFLIENGPFVLEDGQKDLNGTFNIWSWNQFANILYFESPAGVGFSPVSGGGTVYNDLVTTQDNYYALESFFAGFSELLKNDFWVSGESYAGIYVPYLAAYIDSQNQLGSGLFVNLQGVMVGNGVGSFEDNTFTLADFYNGHYLIPNSLYTQLYEACTQSLSSPACNDALNQVNDLTGLLNPYDIYRYCYTGANSDSKDGWLFNIWNPRTFGPRSAGTLTDDKLVGSDVPCLFTAGIEGYLNRPEVKEALHVDAGTTFKICNDTVNANYAFTQSSVDKYQQLMANGYKVLIYSGDTDAAVPYTSTLDWINKLGLNVQEAWRPWYIGDQVVGFVQEYSGLTFTTVKGTGHQVPAWKRQEAYILISSFINGQELPSKTTKKTKKAEVIEL